MKDHHLRRARTSDFMLFLGYCGWGRNQLQGELNVGVWKMASVDSRVLVRELRQETQQLRQLPQLGLDDGIGSWRHLRHGCGGLKWIQMAWERRFQSFLLGDVEVCRGGRGRPGGGPL